MQALVAFALVAMVGLVLLIGLAPSEPGSDELKIHLETHGVAETGAENLVTAVYLGYRAFDTLGETVVLVLSVAGVASILRGKE